MLWSCAMFLMLWSCLECEGVATMPNLIRDSDFKQGELGAWGAGPGEWTVAIHGKSDAAVEAIPGEGRKGSRCVRYTKTAKGNQNIHVDQVVAVRPETIYEVRMWVRGDGTLRPLVAIQTMEWKTLALALALASAEWQEVRFLFHSHGHQQVRFEWFPGSDGKLHRGLAGKSWLDDVSIRQTENPGGKVAAGFAVSKSRAADEIDPKTVPTAAVGKPTPIRRIICKDGTLLYEDGGEVALFGVNFQTALSWEYRGRLEKYGVPLTADALHKLTDENLDQLVRMNVGVVRMHLLPGDFADGEGNLREDSIYLDSLDYTIAACRKRGIYVYLTLLNSMGGRSHYEDAFLDKRDRAEWITDEVLVAKTERYIKALLTHENRYSRVPYKEDPAIAVLAIMNEPRYLDYDAMRTHPALLKRFRDGGYDSEFPRTTYAAFRYDYVKAYLNRLHAAIRSAGCTKPVGWNLNWPNMIRGHEDVFQAVADSKMEMVAFCLYPGQSDVGREYWRHPKNLSGKNYLPFVRGNYEQYTRLRWLLGRRFAGKAKIVYEFETFFNDRTYLYPAMARAFRALGVQMACMWTYALAPSSEYLTGSHLLNLEATPGKAVSFLVAERVFRDTPRYAPYGATEDDDLVFGNCALSFARDLSIFCAEDTYVQTRAHDWDALPLPKAPRQIAGCGDSPFVRYAGTGAYFVDVEEDAIAIEIMPDITRTREHWQSRAPKPYPKACHLDRDTAHPFSLALPGWQGKTTVWRVGQNGRQQIPANGLSFAAKPGRYRVERGRTDQR
ncbi:MAG: hypothetical protein HN904_13590 [Victivallales bacterium]|nr:hypothetical protein [Victivallales bacterium]